MQQKKETGLGRSRQEGRDCGRGLDGCSWAKTYPCARRCEGDSDEWLRNGSVPAPSKPVPARASSPGHPVSDLSVHLLAPSPRAGVTADTCRRGLVTDTWFSALNST